MKDAVLTIRVPASTRRRLQALAQREGRSLSGQAERLIEQGLTRESPAGTPRRGRRSVAGLLRGGMVPTLGDFREVRASLSTSLHRRTGTRAEPRR